MPRVAIVLVFAGLALALPVWAQQAEPRDPSVGGSPDIPLTPARFNAALQYHTAWMLLEPVLEFEGMSEAEIQAVQNGELPESYVKLLDYNQDAIEDIIKATKLTTCDFGVSYETGLDALIPQLGVMRQTVRMLMYDANRLKKIDLDATVERYAAVIRMGEHASQTGTILGVLVGVAITHMPSDEIQELLDENTLNTDQAEVIALALNRILTDDPFSVERALQTEVVSMDVSFRQEFVGIDAGLRIGSAFQLDPRKDNEIDPMDGDDIDAQIDLAVSGYNELISAWMSGDRVAELQNIELKIENEQYGAVANLAMPALVRACGQILKAEAILLALEEELRSVT